MKNRFEVNDYVLFRSGKIIQITRVDKDWAYSEPYDGPDYKMKRYFPLDGIVVVSPWNAKLGHARYLTPEEAEQRMDAKKRAIRTEELKKELYGLLKDSTLEELDRIVKFLRAERKKG